MIYRPPMDREFSWAWTAGAFALFIAVELFIGGLIGELLLGRYRSIALGFTLQGLLHVVSFLIGGFLVGLVSPGKRMVEPAVAAFASVAFMFVLTVFTPYSWFIFSVSRVIVGGGLAFVLALAGAWLGERITGNV